MSFSAIKSALVQAYQDGNFGLDTNYENRDFQPPGGLWAKLDTLPSFSNPATMGKSGSDLEIGIFQITICAPLKQGSGDALDKCDEIRAHFIGKDFSFGAATVTITSILRGPGNTDDGYYRIPLTINYKTYLSRG